MRGTCGLCRRGIDRAISGAIGVVQSPRCLRVIGVWKLVESVGRGCQIGSTYEKEGQIWYIPKKKFVPYLHLNNQRKKLSPDILVLKAFVLHPMGAQFYSLSLFRRTDFKVIFRSQC